MDGVKCSTCRGAGEIEFERGARRTPCVTCSGSGVDYKKTLDAALAQVAALHEQCGGMQMSLDEAAEREAALREELAISNKVGTAIGETLGRVTAERDDLHKSLTAAEQRNAGLMQLAEIAKEWDGSWLPSDFYRRLEALTKPTESGASE